MVIRWEQAITKTLLNPREKQQLFVKFNVEGLLRGDYQSRMEGYAVARQNGWMSANDITHRPVPARPGCAATLTKSYFQAYATECKFP